MHVTVVAYFQGRIGLGVLIVVSAVLLVLSSLFTATRWAQPASSIAIHWCTYVILPCTLAFTIYILHSFVRVNAVLRELAQPGFTLFNMPIPASTHPTPPSTPSTAIPAPSHSSRMRLLSVVSRRPAHASLLLLRLEYSERLGNNVMQYMLGRSRARMMGAAFAAPRLAPPFSDADVFVLPRAPGAVFQVAGGDVALSPFQDAVGVAGRLLRSAAWRRAWAAWLLHPSSGYIMNTALFCGMERSIKSWLTPSLEVALRAARAAAAPLESDASRITHADDPMLSGWRKSDVAIHVRLGDILWGHHAAYRPLPMSFYRAALGALPGGGTTPRRVVLVTEDRTHEIVLRMADWLLRARLASCVRLQSSTLAGDFLTLYTAPALICSISSFAWCAAFLGSASSVVVPVYGLLKKQVWFPSPGVPAMHDMTLRDDGWVDALQLPAATGTQRSQGVRRSARLAQPPPPHALSEGERVEQEDALLVMAAIAGQVHVQDDRVDAASVVQRAGAPSYLSLAAYVPSDAIQAEHMGPAHAVDADLEALLHANAGVVRTATPRVIELEAPCRWLMRYDGDFRHTLESLFDDG